SDPDAPAGPEAASVRSLRLFVALAAPDAVKDAAEAAIRPLRGAGDVRWVTRERLHLTLKFLGPTPPAQAPRLEEILAETANRFSRFVVELGRPGAFPNVRKPQTLWLDIGGVDGALLRALGDAVDEAVHPLGFPREARAFRPHLTIGRVRSPRGLAELSRRLQSAAEGEVVPVPWPVQEFQLVRSDLRPAGPEYTVLHRFPLRAEE
ncbi:MAG TPA: RNA 2',3'-cyclic phosphodiesterase, partial [Armatimonadota bacterium]|nr:RNA 2',3'-cyclic phosphodiesterase [Armatimonadota bacterium]